MVPNEGNPLSSPQPDLEEFLSALSGFFNKQTVPTDPSHLRFLEIFFRSVKSEKGNLLRVSETGALQSIVSVGLGPDFDDDFNKALAESGGEPSPLDVAFREKEPVAIVDITRDPDIPDWFAKLMKKHGFVSLVAVPLMGETEPTGILCAYYHDVCLFDRATLGHLMMIGRMVGGASEKSLAAEQAVSHGEKEKVADHFLKLLIGKPFTRNQVYGLLAKLAGESLPASGCLCGPLTKTPKGLILSITGGIGVPPSALSKQIGVPLFIANRFLSGSGPADGATRTIGEWGEMKGLVKEAVSVDLVRALPWQNHLEGAVIAWRAGARRFSESEGTLLTRLADIASLALHVAE